MALQTAIDQPANPKSWRKIQAVAQRNTQLYEAAFKFIPRNEPAYGINEDKRKDLEDKRKNDKTIKLPPTHASIWPTWNYYPDPKIIEDIEGQGQQQGFMPCHTEFWVESHPQAAQAHREAAPLHAQAAAAHEKAAQAHQRAQEAHRRSQQAHLNTRPAVKVYQTQVNADQGATVTAHNASRGSGQESVAARARTQQVIGNHQTQTAKIEAETALDNMNQASSESVNAKHDANALVVLSTGYRPDMQQMKEAEAKAAAAQNHAETQRKYDFTEEGWLTYPKGVVPYHKRAAQWHQRAAKNHGDAAKAHTAAAENHIYTDDPKGQAAAAQLSQVKGYITLLPIHWTEGENNNLEYHTALMTNNEQPDPFGETKTEAVAHAQQSPGEKPA